MVNSLEDLTRDPHLESVGFWTIAEHPTEGPLRFAASPVDLRTSPMRMTRMQPRLGEHSAEILRECGYDETSISNLTAAGGACRGQDI